MICQVLRFIVETWSTKRRDAFEQICNIIKSSARLIEERQEKEEVLFHFHRISLTGKSGHDWWTSGNDLNYWILVTVLRWLYWVLIPLLLSCSLVVRELSLLWVKDLTVRMEILRIIQGDRKYFNEDPAAIELKRFAVKVLFAILHIAFVYGLFLLLKNQIGLGTFIWSNFQFFYWFT